MSFLDKVTKAVGDVVDKGKHEVDQFVRIQKVNSQIGEIERKIADLKAKIDHAKAGIGDKVVGMLRAGELVSPVLKPLVDEIAGFEQQVTAEETQIADKKAEIEKIKAEDEQKPAPPAQPA